MTSNRRFFVALTLIGISCGGESTAPVRPFAVSFQTNVTVTGRTTLLNGAQVYQCDVPINVQAAGGSGGFYASWSSAELNLRLNSTGQTGILYYFDANLTDWFGSERLNSGAAQSGIVSYSWTGPNTGSMLIRYLVFGPDVLSFSPESRTATIRITCN